MNLEQWIDKFAASIKDWTDSVLDMFEIDLGDELDDWENNEEA